MSISSMTGFGRSQLTFHGITYNLEVRSFNNRFLDIKIRLPWFNGELEQRLQTFLRGRLGRGRIELTIREESGEENSSIVLNRTLATHLGKVIDELCGICHCEKTVAASMLPPVRDLIQSEQSEINLDEFWPVLEAILIKALEQMTQMRRTEGGAITADLLNHLQRLQSLAEQIASLALDEPSRQQQKLTERLQKLVGDKQVVDPVRLAQEVALLADRADISEELARLNSHFDQLHKIIDAHESNSGRRIEFLLQELNRELNTIGSKTASAQVAHLVVEGKSLGEKMREQVQNIE